MPSGLPPKDYAAAVSFPDEIVLRPIGIVRSAYKERFGVPRQAHDGDGPPSVVELFAHIGPEPIQDLDGFDRVWVLSWMHLNGPGWPKRVKPPRGGPKRGLLSTRAPHRPNPIALSAARLLRIEGTQLHFQGLDLLDGTPVLDLKPYVPYADAFPDARAGWVQDAGGKHPDQLVRRD